jgi:hypothetical protein
MPTASSGIASALGKQTGELVAELLRAADRPAA